MIYCGPNNNTFKLSFKGAHCEVNECDINNRLGWWVPLLGHTPLGLQHTDQCFDYHSLSINKQENVQKN